MLPVAGRMHFQSATFLLRCWQNILALSSFQGNLSKARKLVAEALTAKADLILFPEMALAGYPPEDLLLRPGFLKAVRHSVHELTQSVMGIDVVIGHPWEENGRCYNAVSWIRNGQLSGRYFKQRLPNYAVFDEQRYFSPGSDTLVIELKGIRIAVLICEDTWEARPAQMAQEQGAELLLVPNASPYRDDKLDHRNKMFANRYKDTGLPMVYCNLVGGQDELVFDGRSMLMDGKGECSEPGPLCEESLLLAAFYPDSGLLEARDWPGAPDDRRLVS